MKIKISLFIFFLGISFASIAQKGIDKGVNYRSVKDIINDTVYYRKQDTIFKMVYFPGKMEPKLLILYFKKGRIWRSFNNFGGIYEEGKFVKRKFGIRFAFKKMQVTMVKKGAWKYYNLKGEITEIRIY